jgi:hypothetical protein
LPFTGTLGYFEGDAVVSEASRWGLAKVSVQWYSGSGSYALLNPYACFPGGFPLDKSRVPELIRERAICQPVAESIERKVNNGFSYDCTGIKDFGVTKSNAISCRSSNDGKRQRICLGCRIKYHRRYSGEKSLPGFARKPRRSSSVVTFNQIAILPTHWLVAETTIIPKITIQRQPRFKSVAGSS